MTGSVYAVDEFTFLLSGFSYDGNGVDTFFWAGASNRPGPQGFIVPDEYGQYVTSQVGSIVSQALSLLSSAAPMSWKDISTKTLRSNYRMTRKLPKSSGSPSTISIIRIISVIFTYRKSLSRQRHKREIVFRRKAMASAVEASKF